MLIPDNTCFLCTYNNIYNRVRTPGNRLSVHYQKKKVHGVTNPKYLGGQRLQGLKRLRPAKKASCGSAAKRVTRPYGGVLSYDIVRERYFIPSYDSPQNILISLPIVYYCSFFFLESSVHF